MVLVIGAISFGTAITVALIATLYRHISRRAAQQRQERAEAFRSHLHNIFETINKIVDKFIDEQNAERRKILGEWWYNLYTDLLKVHGGRIRYEIVRRFCYVVTPNPERIFGEDSKRRTGVPPLPPEGAEVILALIPNDDGPERNYRSWVESLLAEHLDLNVPYTNEA
jgi:hypothetical protein